MRGKAAFGCMVFIAWSLALVQAEHKVVAVVLKNPNFHGAPVLKLNAHRVLSAPSDQATIQQRTPLVANAVKSVATPNFVGNDAAPVPVMNEKPKKVIRYKLIRLSDEDIKKEQEAKKIKKLQDAEDAQFKKVLYPCRDYSPICGRYKNLWNPGVAQCRDVWMQRNCRETCGLCKIPVGVYLACNDMWHCKKLATHSCVHDWVRETCKSMCGTCDGKKGQKFARVGASSVFVGKKKSLVESKKEKEKEEDDRKVNTVHQAIKLQAKPIKVENPIPKVSKDESKADEDDDIENNQSGDNPDDKDNDDDEDDADDDANEMEKQPADSNMENESRDDAETKDDKPVPEPEVEAKPDKHASVPKVTKKTEQKPAVQKPVAPKVQQKKQKKIAKKVVHDKKPKVTNVQVVKKVQDKKPKAQKVKVVKKVQDKKPKAQKVKVEKKVHDKKVKTNHVKAMVMKQKKQVHVVHHKKAAKKVKKASKKN